MAKRHSTKRNAKRHKAKKPRKAAMAARKAHKKTGKRAGKHVAKAARRRASKRSRNAARMAPAAPIMIPIRAAAQPAKHAHPAKMPALPAYSRDAVMNALVGMLILIAVVSAGIFYPQMKSHDRALTAAPSATHR